MFEKYLENARASISRLPLPNIYHDIMSGVYKRTYHFSQNNIHTRITPGFLNLFFFFLFFDAYCAGGNTLGHCRRRCCCEKKRTVTSCNKTMNCCITCHCLQKGNRHLAFSLLDQRSLFSCEKEMRKMMKTIVRA